MVPIGASDSLPLAIETAFRVSRGAQLLRREKVPPAEKKLDAPPTHVFGRGVTGMAFRAVIRSARNKRRRIRGTPAALTAARQARSSGHLPSLDLCEWRVRWDRLRAPGILRRERNLRIAHPQSRALRLRHRSCRGPPRSAREPRQTWQWPPPVAFAVIPPLGARRGGLLALEIAFAPRRRRLRVGRASTTPAPRNRSRRIASWRWVVVKEDELWRSVLLACGLPRL